MGPIVNQIDQKTALQTIHEWHQIRSYTFAILVWVINSGVFGKFDGLNCLERDLSDQQRIFTTVSNLCKKHLVHVTRFTFVWVLIQHSDY